MSNLNYKMRQKAKHPFEHKRIIYLSMTVVKGMNIEYLGLRGGKRRRGGLGNVLA